MAPSHKPANQGRLKRVLAGSALLLVGASAGLLLGSVLEGPRLMVRRWTEQVSTLEIAAPVSAPSALLEEFEALQQASPQAEKRAAPGPATTRNVVSPRAPDVAAHPPQSASALIAEMKRRRDALERAKPVALPEVESSEPAARKASAVPVRAKVAAGGAAAAATPTSSRVVQVAAYRDRSAARALVDRLQQLGFDSYLSGTRSTSPQRYRVRVRPSKGSSIAPLKNSLESRGFNVWVTRE
jgi:cell division septation protein DedD